MGIFSSLFSLVSGRIPTTPKPKSLGEWILVTSPTPFNRFVTLRSPSIDFSEIEFLKFMKEDGRYVKLNGKIIEPAVKCSYGEDIEYQRLYVKGDDGGILSLDFPANLDLEGDFSSGSTILIIPGTVDGSGERKIRGFVCDCLRRNVFPIVMNPRGCGGTRLTTPRLFTAVDSNDVSVVVQYISMKRPCTTLMAVAWDYGANMLTKYLAESGNETPIVAATCIDNPFDLEEATKYKVYDEQIDGFIGILQTNKGVFYGRGKRFDVRGALTASSILDFERAISMVSYGFDNIEDFYAKSGTRTVIDKVKVHVLFIQNDDVHYIPRSLIAENSYTSLLLYSFNPSRKIDDDRLTLSWCQHLILEWLMAAELKARHPPQQPPPPSNPPLRVATYFAANATVERGQVLQTAQVVMSMLDVTMPEALSDAQKKKVLTAVGRGETLIKALQDAVPDNVRGKLTTAVSSILQSPGSDLKSDKLLKLRHKEVPGNNSKDLDKERLENEKCKQDVQSLDQKKRTSGSEGGYPSVDHSPDMSARDMESGKQPLEISQKKNDSSPNMDKENQHGMGNSYKNTQPHGGNTAETDAAIMGEPNTVQDSSRTFDVSDRARDISIQRKFERGPEEGQSNPEEHDLQENDFASDQDKKSETCKTEENSKPQGYSGNEIDSHPRSKNSDNIILDSCESQNQNEELKKDSVSSNDGGDEDEQHLSLGQVDKSTKRLLLVGEGKQRHPRERQNNDNAISSSDEGINLRNKVMVGAITGALVASALIAHQHSTKIVESLDDEEKSKESFKTSEMPEITENNIVASLAEKAMPASPVVPMKEGCEVDHERHVSMLAEQGQKGGILKLAGKVAFLWGGIRGAKSLTDKLISSLRLALAERPLIQRILGFIFMVFLLRSPVVLSLLPTLMHSFGISEFACIAGLYISMIMITLQGERIRKQYGFDLAKNFLKGLVGGAILLTLIHAINWSLGCGNLLWPAALSSLSSEHVALVKVYGHALLIVQGIVTATCIATAEELLLQSQLTREIGADFVYPRGLFISGLVFALSQRSIWEIPGLWLLAMSLSGAQQRSRGNLALPIGLRAGILSADFILRTGGFLVYEATTSSLTSILAVNFILSCFIYVCCSPLHILGTQQ